MIRRLKFELARVRHSEYGIWLLIVPLAALGALPIGTHIANLEESLALGLMVVIAFAARRFASDAALRHDCLIALGLGVLLIAVPFGPAQNAGDLLVAYALVPIAFVAGRHIGRDVMRVVSRVPSSTIRDTGERPLPIARAGAAVFAVSLLLVLALPDRSKFGWRFAGPHTGAALWNAHLLGAPLERDGFRLRDMRVSTPSGAPVVGSSDFPVVSYVKLLHPAAFDGVRLENAFTLLSYWAAFLGVAFLAFAMFRNLIASLLAGTLFLFLPVSGDLRQAAPFDFSPALFVLIFALRGTPAWLLAAGAFGSAFLNVPNGFEAALLTASFAVTGRVKAATAGVIAAAGILGSAVAAFGASVALTGVSTRELWWKSQELPRLLWAEERAVAWPVLVVALGIAIAVAVRLRRRGEAPQVFAVAMSLTAVGAIAAIPDAIQELSVLSPAWLLGAGLPASGWPSLRMLQLICLAITLLCAYGSTLVTSRYGNRQRWRASVGAMAVAGVVLLNFTLPRYREPAIPRFPKDATVVEFPVAEPFSAAGLLYADELFERDVRTAQPLPFLAASSLPFDLQPQAPRMLDALRATGVTYVVLRRDVYENPRLRRVLPQLYVRTDTAYPLLGGSRDFELYGLQDYMQIYKVSRSG